jgi:hypothetical protein
VRRFGVGMGLLWILGLVAIANTASAQDDTMINNGQAPPSSDNVIDAADDYSTVFVRNVGCPPGWPGGSAYDPCPSPGAPTEVQVVDGGEVDLLYTYESSTGTLSGGLVRILLIAWNSSIITVNEGSSLGDVDVFDSSTLTMNGGEVGGLQVHDSSTVTINDGWIANNFRVNESTTITMNGGIIDSNVFIGALGGLATMAITGGAIVGNIATEELSTVTLSGGWVGGSLRAEDDSVITIIGNDFEVNGLPVPYGDLEALVGHLTGTLASGHSVDNTFRQGGYDDTGTITLVEYVPEPNQVLLCSTAILTLALLRRRAGHDLEELS